MLIDNLFAYSIISSEFNRIVFPHLKSIYFNENSDKLLYKKIKSYQEKYNRIPKFSDLKLSIDVDSDISVEDTAILKERLARLKKVEAVSDQQMLIDEVEQWVKNRALELATYDFIYTLEHKKDDRAEKIALIQDALNIQFIVELGHDYYEDVEKRLEFYLNDAERIPVDIDVMNDALGGGLIKKTMTVLMSSTNIGKCQKYDSEVLMGDGSYKTLEYLFKNQNKSHTIISMDDKHNLVHKGISAYYDSGVIDCFRLETRDGIYTEPSSTHPYYTLSGWKQVSDLRVGDFIAIPKQYNNFENIDNSLTEVEAEMLGLLIADGSLTSSIGFSNVDNQLLTRFELLCKSLVTDENNLKFRYSNNVMYVSSKNYKNEVRSWAKRRGIFKLTSHTKFIPDDVFTTSKKKIALFLGAMYACDGWTASNVEKFEIGISLCNVRLILQLRRLLLRFGIKTRILSSTGCTNNKNFKKYSLIIKDYNSVKLFYENIKIPLTYKQNNIEQYVTSNSKAIHRSSYSLNFPKELWGYINQLLIDKGMKKFTLKKMIGNFRSSSNISVNLLTKINDILRDDFLSSLIFGDICFDEITKLEFIGKHQCYDLTIAETHNFVCNDMIVHNTTNMCHYSSSFVKSGKNVLYITGEESEEEILKKNDANILDIDFDELGKGLDKNKFMSKFQKASVKAHGKLIVKGFGTGTANTNHIKNLLLELKTKKNFVPDIVVLDGLNNFASSKLPAALSGTPIYVKNVAEEQRALCYDFDYALLTNAQFNRGARAKAEKADLEDVGEAYAISQTADFAASIIQTDELREQKKYIIKVLKTRISKTKSRIYTVGIDYDKMRLFNLSKDQQEIPMVIKDKLKHQKERDEHKEEDMIIFDFG